MTSIYAPQGGGLLLKPPAAPPPPLTLGDVAKMTPAQKLATFGFVGATAATRQVAAARRAAQPQQPKQPVKLVLAHGPQATGPRPTIEQTRPALQRTPYFPGQQPATHSSTGIPIYARPSSKQASLADVTYQQALSAKLGGKSLAQELAKAPKVSPIVTTGAEVAGGLLGVPIANQIRQGNILGAGANAAMMFVPGTKLLEGLRGILGAGRGVEAAGEAAAALHEATPAAETAGARVAGEAAPAAAPRPRPLPAAIRTAQTRADALRSRLTAAQEKEAQWLAGEKAKVAAAPLTHSQATARLAELNATHDELVQKLIPETSPYGPQVAGSAAKKEQLWRNTANAKLPEGAKIQTVKQEEAAIAEAHLHDLASTPEASPTHARLHDLVTERQQLQDALSQHAEASLFGGGKQGPTVALADSQSPAGGYIRRPATYLRFGELPTEGGVGTPSTDWLAGKPEAGVSVYHAWHDPVTGKYVMPSGSEQYLATQGTIGERPIFEVKGTPHPTELGNDGEPLLHPGSVKVVTRVHPDKVVNEQDPWLTIGGKELPPHQTPDWHGQPEPKVPGSPFAPEGSTPQIGVNPHRDTIVKLGHALDEQQAQLDQLTAAHEARVARISQPQTAPIATEAETQAKLAAAQQDPRFYDYSKGRPDVTPWGNREVARIRREGAPAGATLRPLREGAPVGGRVEGPLTLRQTGIEGLRGIDPVLAQVEAMHGAEANKRFDAFEQALQADSSPAGRLKARALLAGKYPTLGWGKFQELTPEAHQAMHDFIAHHEGLTKFQKLHAGDGLNKLIDGVKPARHEVKALRTAFGPDVTKNLVNAVSDFAKYKALAYDVLNTPRAVMASADVSGLGRQSLMAAMLKPTIVAKNVPDMFRAMFSEEKYNALMDANIHNNPYVTSGRAHEVGVDLTTLSAAKGETHFGEGVHGSVSTREEPFATPLAERIPGVGHVVRGSGRAYTYLLDKTRLDLAQYLDALVRSKAGQEYRRFRWSPEGGGRGLRLVKEPLDPNDPEVARAIGSLANSATGRGDLGDNPIGRSADLVNLVFFSPKLAKSRIDFLANPAFYARMHPVVRRQAYRAMAGLIGTMAAAVTLSKEAGSPINLDPRSSDFAKIRIGPMRWDLAGGFLQYTRILSEIISQQTVTSTGKTLPLSGFIHGAGKFGSQSDLSVLLNFLRNKLAPMASAGVDVAKGSSSIGQALKWKSLDPTVNPVIQRMVPLSLQDAINVGQGTAKHGLPAAIAAGIGGFLGSAAGTGVQSYTLKKKSSSGGGGGGIVNYAPSSSGGGSIYAPSSGGGGSIYAPGG